MIDDPAPNDHVRPRSDSKVPTGVYRVVGVSDDTVTLLLVGDADGTRRYTGVVEHVSRDVLSEQFESAQDPGERIDPLGYLRGWVALVRNAIRR